MSVHSILSEREAGDLLVVFDDSKQEGLPIQAAYLKTEASQETLLYAGALSGSGLWMGVQPERCLDPEQFCRPLAQRQEELEGYRKRSCSFRRSSDPDSNFYAVEKAGNGRLFIHNQGQRSLRFGLPDGSLFRVCARDTVELDPAKTWTRIDPYRILLDLGGPLDTHICAAHVRDEGTWRDGDVLSICGSHVDSFYLRVRYRDDCLGVFEAYSGYYLERPRLEILDMASYGPVEWLVRNQWEKPLAIHDAEGRRLAAVPPDGRAYKLNAPAGR